MAKDTQYVLKYVCLMLGDAVNLQGVEGASLPVGILRN